MAKNKLKRIFFDVRVIILIAAIFLALYSITGFPSEFTPLNKGVVINSVDKDSAAYDAGIRTDGNSKDVIISVDGIKITSIDEYNLAVANLEVNKTVLIETENNFYKLTTKQSQFGLGTEDLGIKVSTLHKTNLKLGLDLQGGTRVMLQPETELSEEDLELVIGNMNRRLNIFGLSDVVVREASDLEGHQFIMVEVAGANEKEVRDLVAKQGKFEAKISNETVFNGNEVTDVCRSAQCSGINFQSGGCFQSSQTSWGCSFYFTISINNEAAQRQADATGELAVLGDYLSEPLQLYLDDELVDELQIGQELRGNPITTIRITGSGSGESRNDATADAIANMKRLQTILITGSLPVKLEIVKTDSISPILGEQFLKNAFKVGIIAILLVVAILVIAYRNVIIAIPIIMTSVLEIFLMLGFASLLPFLSWTIDLAAIAGIVAAVGTGVNDQILITDDALKGGERRLMSWKEKLKSAFSVIMGAYLTLVVAMLPLFAIGAGMLRGFALTTIIGMTVGVFITRPVYAKVLEILTEKN
jgi:preprotein translocase subunit SecD